MGKFNLGDAVTKISSNVDKDNLYLDNGVMEGLVADMEQQFNILRDSLYNINTLLNKAVARKLVRGKSAEVFKGWARKCNSQAMSTEKRKNSLIQKYNDDRKNYKIQQLEKRIVALEEKMLSIRGE